MENYGLKESIFTVARLSGGPKEIGTALARYLAKAKSGYFDWFKNLSFKPSPGGFRDLAGLEAACGQACPGITEEIAGFAAEAGIPMENIAFWMESGLRGANCSHAAVSPRASRTGAPLVMRSYEWNDTQDDLTLCVTKKTGAYAHIGCSIMTFGRMDGMNEKGLSVTMSGGMAAGLPPDWNYKKGLNFWIIIRGMLERCADLGEAVSMLAENVPTGNHCLILADKTGRATLAEMSGGEIVFKERGEDNFIAEVNHFKLAPLKDKNKIEFVLDGSVPRLAFIEKTLKEAGADICPDILKGLLAGRAPNGCFGPWYSQGFGTLWASVFDLEKLSAEYCFGSPGFNPWRTFDFSPGGPQFEAIETVFAELS